MDRVPAIDHQRNPLVPMYNPAAALLSGANVARAGQNDSLTLRKTLIPLTDGSDTFSLKAKGSRTNQGS